VGPPSINVHDWEVCHRESQITVSSGCLDTFDQIVYIVGIEVLTAVVMKSPIIWDITLCTMFKVN
jgi:hypothetical protein